MGDYSTLETIHRMYISMAALVFNLILCVMISLMSGRDEEHNKSFGALTFVVFFGNLVTCITSFIRRADSVHFPPQIPYLAYLLSSLANIYVAAYFSQYIESYFEGKHEHPRLWRYVNKILFYGANVLICIPFIWKLPRFDGTPESAAIEPMVRYVFGYAFELYFIIYALVYFVRYGRLLNRRAFMTAVWGMVLTIGGVVAQLLVPGILVNYVGATLGLYLFFFGVETPDYRKLMQTMAELEEAREAADRANRSKSEFLANMSHEIRTPINAVLGMNEMILRESDNEQITSYARNVESSGRNLLSIINDILDFSKIESGHMELIYNNYKLASVLNDVTGMVGFRARTKGLDFDIFVDETLPGELHGDEVRIRQIITNLLTNAVKYTEKGSISLSVEGTRDSEDMLTLICEVSDTGIGIREEDKEKLFDQFERVNMDQTRTIEGTGLGLAITHDLVKMMDGTIELESSYGVGSTFTVKIPQKIVSDAPVGDYRQVSADEKRGNSYTESFKAPDARVLAVDDTVLNLMVFKELLKKTGLQIDTAKSGGDAVRMTIDTHYDLIFMDQRMPHTDGIQTMHMIRSQRGGANTDTPIICLTADAVSGARERYIAEGFVDYLTKPLEGGPLEDMLIRYLPSDKVIRIKE